MLFSVVVPMYNSEKYIDECIESVLNQSEDNFQLIIVNDGSSDSCGDIADYYASNDPRILVIHQKNTGSFHARVNGVDNAIGRYIVFLDADDTLKVNALERLKEHINSDKPDVIIYRAESISEKGMVSKSKKLFEDGAIFEGVQKKSIYEKLIDGASLNTLWIKAIKLECFNNEKVRSYPPISMGDDVLYTLEPITNANKIKYIDEILYNYRIISTSQTRKFQPNVYKGFKIITKAKLEYLSKWEMKTDNYIKTIYSRFLKNISGIALYSQANIKDREREYLNVLNDIKNDDFFHEVCNSSYSNLSLVVKFPNFLILKGRVNLLRYLKPMATKLQKYVK